MLRLDIPPIEKVRRLYEYSFPLLLRQDHEREESHRLYLWAASTSNKKVGHRFLCVRRSLSGHAAGLAANFTLKPTYALSGNLIWINSKEPLY